MTLTELVSRFESEQDVGESSRKLYTRNVWRFIRWTQANELPFNSIGRQHVIAYKRSLSNMSSLTVDSYMTSIRIFYKWLDLNGHYDNVMIGVRNPRKYKGFKKRPLSVDEINNLLRSINRETAKGKRDYAMISLMLRSAMRTVEVSRCNFSDLQESNGSYFLWIRRKGQSEKTKIGLTFKAFDAINDYLVERKQLSDESPLFANIGPRLTNKRIQPQSLSFIIKHRMRAAGIVDPKVTTHSLRHTAAIMALKQGASLHEVQLFLGHTNPATTQLYIKAIEEERRIYNTPGKLIDEVF